VVHGSKQAKNVRGCVQIVTALKSLQMQANQEFQRTLFILNETLLIFYNDEAVLRYRLNIKNAKTGAASVVNK